MRNAALTLFYKCVIFFQSFFYFTFFQKIFLDIRYTFIMDPIKIPYFIVPDLGPFCLGEKSPEDTIHLTHPHSMGSKTACWFIGKDGLSTLNIPYKKRNAPLRTVQLSGISQVIGQINLYQCKGMSVTAASHVFCNQASKLC